MTPPPSPRRYHPALVALHWFLAFFILAALLLGTFVLKEIPNASPDKVEALRAHMGGGIAILLLMALRLAIRRYSVHPEAAWTGNALLDRVAKASHVAFYVLVGAMAAAGLTTAIQSGAIALLAGAPVALPETFTIFSARVAHGLIAKALFALIGLHFCGVLYHQLVRRDGLLRRMWFGRRWPERA